MTGSPVPLDSYSTRGIHSSRLIIRVFPVRGPTEIHVFTDSSKMNGPSAFAVCVFDRGILTETLLYKLSAHSSVFQTEFLAIVYAVHWVFNRGLHISIYSDSLSAIKSIQSPTNLSLFIQTHKDFLARASAHFSLYWVRAHAGEPGNEASDYHAK